MDSADKQENPCCLYTFYLGSRNFTLIEQHLILPWGTKKINKYGTNRKFSICIDVDQKLYYFVKEGFVPSMGRIENLVLSDVDLKLYYSVEIDNFYKHTIN